MTTAYETITIKPGARVLAPGKSYTAEQPQQVTNATRYGGEHWQFEAGGVIYVVHRMYVEWRP
jgi:hypothetical protein